MALVKVKVYARMELSLDTKKNESLFNFSLFKIALLQEAIIEILQFDGFMVSLFTIRLDILF